MNIISIALALILGYGVASYQAARYQLAEEIDDHQREILIASRLLQEYGENCAGKKQSNFSPYVEHAITKYELQLNKSHQFPYFMNTDFINDHEESIFRFKEKIDDVRRKIASCKKSGQQLNEVSSILLR